MRDSCIRPRYFKITCVALALMVTQSSVSWSQSCESLFTSRATSNWTQLRLAYLPKTVRQIIANHALDPAAKRTVEEIVMVSAMNPDAGVWQAKKQKVGTAVDALRAVTNKIKNSKGSLSNAEIENLLSNVNDQLDQSISSYASSWSLAERLSNPKPIKRIVEEYLPIATEAFRSEMQMTEFELTLWLSAAKRLASLQGRKKISIEDLHESFQTNLTMRRILRFKVPSTETKKDANGYPNDFVAYLSVNYLKTFIWQFRYVFRGAENAPLDLSEFLSAYRTRKALKANGNKLSGEDKVYEARAQSLGYEDLRTFLAPLEMQGITVQWESVDGGSTTIYKVEFGPDRLVPMVIAI